MARQAISRAMAYYRLSEKDKAKNVSDSIENQKKLIQEYLSRHENITLVKEAHDDGYTGTNYNRPGFLSVMQAVEAGEVDCIIVKDLSRLGREYIETGTYLEKIFPALGVRFIAINDDYDSKHPKQSDDLIVPIKNLMNETYCRDLSNKLRRQFAVQRKNGEYMGSFVFYGYCKSKEDKHKLVVDEYAAGIVRQIFYAKLQGYSQAAIANTLNAEGVLPPMAYKRQLGLNYKSGFQTSDKSSWSVVTVNRILTNRIYIGDLIQGKRGTPNFKVKTVVERPMEEWVIVEHNHEPIIDPLLFNAIQRLLGRDTRRSPSEETVLPLSGMVFCGDCERPLVRRSVSRGKKKFFYYVCSTNKRREGCTSHSIEQSLLERTVLNALCIQIQTVMGLEDVLRSIHDNDLRAAQMKKLRHQIETKEAELESHRSFKSKLLEALSDNLIDREEYTMMRDKYRNLEETCQEAIEKLQEKMVSMEATDSSRRLWVEQYAKYRELSELSREAVVTLIDRITVYEDKRVEITFNYKDEIAYYRELAATSVREVS